MVLPLAELTAEQKADQMAVQMVAQMVVWWVGLKAVQKVVLTVDPKADQ